MNKKLNILFAGIFLAFMLSACQKEDSSGGGDEPSENITVYGSVRGSDSLALQGVTVSDGTVCVKTDADGIFRLPSKLGDDVKFFFVTTPEGYAAPVQEGIPVFFKRVSELKKDADGTYRNVNFTLDRIDGNPDRFTLLISADPQPRSSGATYDKFAYHSLDCCQDLYRDWRETASKINGRPVYGMVLGDIVHENMTLFKQYTDALALNGFPTYNLPGNHDHDLDKEGSTGGSNMIGLQTYEKNFGPTNYSVELGKIHLVVMDDMYVPYDASGKCPKGDYLTGFTDNAWIWLRNDLANIDRDRTIFFCAHGVIFMKPDGTEMGTRTNNHLSDVAHLLAKFGKTHAWFGHSHVTYNHNYSAGDKNFPNVESHMLPRSTGELWTNERLSGGTPRGYVVVDVDGTEVSWKYKCVPYQSGEFCGNSGEAEIPYMNYSFTGGVATLKSDGSPLNENYQIVAYPPSAYPEAAGYVVANVFWWDDKWSKPVWTVEGGSPQTMKAFTSATDQCDINDKTMVNAYRNKEKSTLGKGDYDWNHNVHTLFYSYVGDSDNGSGTVSVTDRFGNTYSTVLTW